MPYRIVDPKAFKVFKHLAVAALDEAAGTAEERRTKAVEALRRLPALAAATGLALLSGADAAVEDAPAPPPGVSPMPADVAAHLDADCGCGHPLRQHQLGPPHPCGESRACGCAHFHTLGGVEINPQPHREPCDRCGHPRDEHRPFFNGGPRACHACGCPRYYERGTAARARGEAPRRTDWRDDLDDTLGARHRPPPSRVDVRIVEAPRPGGTAEMWDDTAFGRSPRKKF